jgi:LmbE family N-acetylglucosaminyl deacetylase
VGKEAADVINVLIIGAHPDDVDADAGGTAALFARNGHRVMGVSVTNGDTGHHEIGGVPLARRRRAEAAEAGKRLGLVEYRVLDNHDGRLLPNSLPVRDELTRLIRQFEPDLVMTHRAYDYHPDHRATSQLVVDALCMSTVPNVVSDVPYLKFTPFMVYMYDPFTKPYPFIPDIVVATDETVETKVDAMDAHVSQMYEFLAHIKHAGPVPDDPKARRDWLRQSTDGDLRKQANLYRERLIEIYGKERGSQVQYAEAFEHCEYGAPLTAEAVRKLFPFVPAS